MMTNSIEVNNLYKFYGKKCVLDDVSLKIKTGEIYGLIGLNGAGKTTLIRLLLGLIRPSKGDCKLKGKHVSKNSLSIWRDVGHIVETPHAYPDLTVLENLKISQRIRLINDRAAINEVIRLLQLEKHVHVKVKHLSLGNKQRLGIAKAILHRPTILILDEPTNGLDPEGIVEIRNILKRLASEYNVTIFLSSHILAEITKIASKIGIIHKGKLIKELSIDELDNQLRKSIHIDSTNRTRLKKKLRQYHYHFTENSDGSLVIQDEQAIQHPEIIASLLVKEKVPLIKLYKDVETLEQYFLRTVHKGGGTR